MKGALGGELPCRAESMCVSEFQFRTEDDDSRSIGREGFRIAISNKTFAASGDF